MKSLKFLLVGTALFVSFTAFSQTDTTKKDTTTQKTDTTKKKPTSLSESMTNESATTTTNAQDQQATISQPSNSANSTTTPQAATSNDATSGVTSSTPKPNSGRYYIPVLGSYTATATSTDNKSIIVTADESNPGKIWIDGLTATKIYALLKTAPGTYKIPAQKQDGNSVAEGTVMYDESSKQINVCVGCGYNEQTPAVAEATTATPEATKGKKDHHVTKVKATPVVTFTGTKADQGTVSILQ